MCVVLNACHSKNLVDELVNEHGVPFVVSWSAKVDNRAASHFAMAFYNYLGAKRDNSEDFEGGFQAATIFFEISK